MPNAEGNFHHYLVFAEEAQGERGSHCADVPLYLLHYFLLVTEMWAQSDSTGFKIALKLISLKCITMCLQPNGGNASRKCCRCAGGKLHGKQFVLQGAGGRRVYSPPASDPSWFLTYNSNVSSEYFS